MSDGLDVRIKTILEADEAASASRIKGQMANIEKTMKSRPIKVPIEVDATNTAKSVEQSVKAATSSIKGRKVVVPVEAEIQIDTKSQYLKRALIEDFRKLKAQAGSLKLDTGLFENAFNTGALKTAKQELTILEKHLRAVSAESRSALPDLAITNFSSNVQKAVAQTAKLETQLRSLSKAAPTEVSSKLASLRGEFEKLASIPNATEADVKVYNTLSREMDNVINTITKLKAADKNFKLDVGADKLKVDIDKIQQNLLLMKVNWSKFLKDPNLVAQWNQLFDSTKVVGTRAEVTKLGAEVQNLSKQIQVAGLDKRNIWGQLSNNFQKFWSWLAVGGITAETIRGMREMISAVKAVDLQMTELRKVTDETSATYDKFFAGASKRAVELATSLDKYIGSVADFSRMGFDIASAQKLADVATIYFNVGDGIQSMEESSSSVISTLKAFNIEASQSTKIIDIFNEVGKIYCRL